jgi:hypothetical protein
VRGKKLRVSWEEELLPNTTYQFNFGKGIKDVNEGNVNPDLIYVFSTGSYIDSLSIRGEVVNSKDNAPVAGASVLLYRNDVDSLPMTSPPDFFGLTDDSGIFRINYLPADSFKLFVLVEENNNYMYDGPPESIGFIDEMVASSLNDSTSQISIPTFIESDTVQYVVSQNGTDYGFYEIVFNTPAPEPSISFSIPGYDIEIESVNSLNKTRDSLKSWVSFPDVENLEELEIFVTDGAGYVDTLFWYLETDPKYRQKPEFKVTSNTNRSKLDLEQAFSLRFRNPLVEADTSLFFFLEDSVEVQPKSVERSNLNRDFLVHYPFDPASQYVFKAYPGAFKDYFGAYNDSISIPFSLRDSEYYGSLLIDVSTNDSIADKRPKLLRVFSESNSLTYQASFTDSLKVTLEKINPGMYSLDLIFDTNENGEWDTGNYLKKLQPERFLFYPEKVEVRSNWEFEIEWILPAQGSN